jgi:hypothetical protein
MQSTTPSNPILPYPFSLLFCPRRHAGLVEQPSELEVVEMLQVIDWLEYYQEQMRVFGYDESSLKSMARFPVIAEDLLRFDSNSVQLCG